MASKNQRSHRASTVKLYNSNVTHENIYGRKQFQTHKHIQT